MKYGKNVKNIGKIHQNFHYFLKYLQRKISSKLIEISAHKQKNDFNIFY